MAGLQAHRKSYSCLKLQLFLRLKWENFRYINYKFLLYNNFQPIVPSPAKTTLGYQGPRLLIGHKIEHQADVIECRAKWQEMKSFSKAQIKEVSSQQGNHQKQRKMALYVNSGLQPCSKDRRA